MIARRAHAVPPRIAIAQAAAAPPDRVQDQTANIARFIGFLAALGFVVVRFGMAHQLCAYLIGSSLYLHILFAIPAVLGVFLSGGLKRVFQGRTAFYWTAYAFWLFVAVPFSAWPRGSYQVALTYLRAEYIVMFVIAGLTVTFAECRAMMRAVCLGAVCQLLVARIFTVSRFGRASLAFGTIDNPNDVACVVALILPFLLWVALTSRWVPVRFLVLPVIGYGMYYILATGSRGAAMGLAAEFALYLLLGTALQRIALLAGGTVLLALVLMMAPKEAVQRIMTTFSNEAGTQVELAAVSSRVARLELMKKAIGYTLEHPLVGVGPGQMADVNGISTRRGEWQGVWQDAHNTLLQASSECGIPALVFLAAGLMSAWLRIRATHRKARARPDCQDIRTMALCIMLALVGFSVAAFFLNFAYLFYAAALAGLAAAVSSASSREFEARSAAAPIRKAEAIAAPVPRPWRAAPC